MEYRPEHLSPLPIVDLTKISAPFHGWALKRHSYCTKKFLQNDACRSFYSSLAAKTGPGGLVQCPFGFSAYRFDLAGKPYAVTGLIPFPRMGGDQEKARAKDYPDAKISFEEVTKITENLDASERARLNSVDQTLQSYPSALHEIRKYNRTVKQEAERLCMAFSPSDPDKADPRLVSIFKCSELMSLQFEVLELIANQSLVTLPLNFRSEVYKVFDKCVRFLQSTDLARQKNIVLKIEGASPIAKVNDKTFHIIATVLIENAIKYCKPQTEILIRIKQLSPTRCEVAVNNIAPHVEVLPNIFEKGVRVNNDGTGMGYGLFLAQQVARQHGTEIKCKIVKFAKDFDNYIFSFELEAIPRNEKNNNS
jgi:K+-sensing histidine kinase KdpD